MHSTPPSNNDLWVTSTDSGMLLSSMTKPWFWLDISINIPIKSKYFYKNIHLVFDSSLSYIYYGVVNYV